MAPTYGAWWTYFWGMVPTYGGHGAPYWNKKARTAWEYFYKYNLKFRKYFKDICKQPHPMAKPGSDSAPAASLAHVLLLAKRDDSTQLQLRHSSSSSLVARVTTLENKYSELGLISLMFVTLPAPACSGPAFAVRGNSFIGMSKDATVPSAIPVARPVLAFVHDFSRH